MRMRVLSASKDEGENESDVNGPLWPLRTSVRRPVSEPILASASWDHTVRLWNVFASKKSFLEPLAQPTDVLAVAFRPDGKQLASTTLNGAINIWDVNDGEQIGTIDGKRDIAGGRKDGDHITAANNQLSKHFTSICEKTKVSVPIQVKGTHSAIQSRERPHVHVEWVHGSSAYNLSTWVER